MRSQFGRRLCALMVLACVLWGAPAPAQGASLTVLSETAEVEFAQEIRFELAAQSEYQIQEVILFYRLSGSAVVGRAYPEFDPGTRIEAQWTWELEPGALPPGATITYDWQLRDAGGQELRTEKRTITYADDRFQWQEASAGMVHVYAYAGSIGAEDLLEMALEALESVEREIGVQVEQPIHIYVYRNKSDMGAVLPSRSERYDEMVTVLGMVVSDDTLLLLGSADNFDKTLAHELSHIVVGQATRNPLGGLPRWLDEGLAMVAEGELPANNRRALDRAIARDELISVRSLSGYSGDPTQVDLFYGEAHSLVSFMLEQYGRDQMLALLGKFKEGTYQEDALQAVYGFGLDELNARWREGLGLGGDQPRAQPGDSAPQDIPLPCGAALLPGALLVGSLYVAGRRRQMGND